MAAAGGSSPSPPDILKEVDTIPLNLDDDALYDVKKALLPIAVRWKDVGIALRLKQGDLDAVETLACPRTCLSEMLTMWLRKKYNVERFGEPTWRRLVEVVMDSAGGADPALANSIAEEHKVKRLLKTRSHSADSINAFMSNKGHYMVVAPHHEFVRQATSQRMSWLTSFTDWFHGKIPCEDAESKLEKAPNGCFLVRESCSQPGSFVLSLKHQGDVRHWLVHSQEDATGSWSYELRGSGMSFKTIIDLVKHYKEHYISADGEKLKIACPKGTGHPQEILSWPIHGAGQICPLEFSAHPLNIEPTHGSHSRLQSMESKLRLLPSPLDVKRKQLSASASNLVDLEAQDRHRELKMIFLSSEDVNKLYSPEFPHCPANEHRALEHSTSDDVTMKPGQRKRSATYTLERPLPDKKPPKKKNFLDWIRSLKRTKKVMEAYPPPNY